MKKPAVHVTDHALIRYLERVVGYDLERLRCEVGALVEQAALAGATSTTIDGCNYRLCGKTLVTVVHKKAPNIRTGGKQ